MSYTVVIAVEEGDGEVPGRDAASEDAIVNGRPILFVGDSITEQWSQHRPRFFAERPFLNRGIGGQTTRDLRARFAAEVERARPRAIHIMGGINDIAENGGPMTPSETQDNLAAMMAAARSAGGPVLIASVTPAAAIGWNPGVRRVSERILALNVWLRAEAERTGATYLDYHSRLRTPEGAMRRGLGPDGVHLHAKGYRRIEPVLDRALDPLFGPQVRDRNTSWRAAWGRLAPRTTR